MSDIIQVESVEEHKDGSATYSFAMAEGARASLSQEGLKLILYCSAAKLDTKVVYQFIEDHMRYENGK
mgnify:CR=1 FL=1